MIKKTGKIRSKYVINMIPIMLLTFYYYTHYIEGTISFVMPLGLTMFWLLHSITISSIPDVLFNQGSKWWIIYGMLALTMTVIGFSSTNVNFFITRIPFYLIPPMGYFVIKHYRVREMKLLLSIMSIIFFANLLYNIGIWTVMPEIFEEQESTEFSIQYSTMMNLASTSFVAVSLFLIGTAFMMLMNVDGIIRNCLCLAVMVLCGFFILFVNTRGTTTLLLGVMAVGMFLAFREPNRTGVRSYYISRILILLFVGSFFVLPLLIWVADNIESTRLAERLNDVISFSESKGNTDEISEGGSMAERIALAQTSLNTFLSNPLNMLIGIGDHTVSFGMDLHKSGIGNHSEFIDVLARYGIVGGFIFVKILKTYYCNLRSFTKDRDVLKYVNIVFYTFILYGFLNNVFHPLLQIFTFIVFPIIIKMLSNNTQYVKQ